MANLIPLAIADVELQISTAIAIGATSFVLNSAHDDDGVALPAGKYCFTIDSGTSNKEYLLGQLNGVNVTGVVSVSRQGVETAGAVRTHRVGSPAIITNFAALQRTVDILRGVLPLDGASPVGYDAEPTLADRKDLATVGYVLDNITGGTVVMNAQVLSATAGETFTAGSLVYFNTADQEWYRTDADTLATVQNTQIGIALGAGANGVAISGGVQISGSWTTTGLTAGALYYASNTAGAIVATTPGTNNKLVGLALSSTRLLLLNHNFQGAFAGTGEIPSSTNKFITVGDIDDNTIFQPLQIVPFTASGTWTKDAGLKYVIVEVVGGGGGGHSSEDGAGGGAGGYSKKLILASSLAATETVTVGNGGAIGASGSSSSFGVHLSATGGSAAGGQRTSGSGGIGSSGNINMQGGPGHIGDSNAAANIESGAGGNSFFGGGGNGGTTSSFGQANSGGGGSGSNVGGSGIVIVTEYYS